MRFCEFSWLWEETLEKTFEMKLDISLAIAFTTFRQGSVHALCLPGINNFSKHL